MAEYKTIKGFKTQSYATDPVAATAAWSSGGTLNTARRAGMAGGIQSLAFVTGGSTAPAPTAISATETYDGTSWTETGHTLNNARRYGAGFGTTTAGLAVGGTDPTVASDYTEEYNGSAWSEDNDLNTARTQTMCAAGAPQTAGLVFGGNPGSLDTNESWNGTSWSEENDLNTGRSASGGAGTQTAALCAAGNSGSITAICETWNGTSWTEVNNVNQARMGVAYAGHTNTAALIFGGETPSTTVNTELWDGTSWTEVANMANANYIAAGAGTSLAALNIGGYPVASVGSNTEEWSDYTATNPAPDKTMMNEGQIWYNTTGAALKYTAIAAGTWASGGTLGRVRRTAGIFGTQSASVIAGGESPPSPTSGYTNATEEYDGSSWTEVNTMNRQPGDSNTGTGILTAGMIVGGYQGTAPAAFIDNVESYDGTSWDEAADINTARAEGAVCGTLTAAVVAGGSPGSKTESEEWNGTSWAEGNDLNTGRARMFGQNIGTQTAAVAAGGNNPPPQIANVELYDGTCWSESTDMPATGSMGMGSGTQDAYIVAGGGPGSGATTATYIWNGSSWAAGNALSQARSYQSGSGNSSTSALYTAGAHPSSSANITATEEWDWSTKTVKTVTVS
jgi:hypothetical protein